MCLCAYGRPERRSGGCSNQDGMQVRDGTKDHTLKNGDERVDFEDAEDISVMIWKWFGMANGERVKHKPQMWAMVTERGVVLSTALEEFCEERYICVGSNPSEMTRNYRFPWIANSYLNSDFFFMDVVQY